MTMPEFKQYQLKNGLAATITDETSHYFGGYYHVKLQVTVALPLCADYFASSVEFDDACHRLGDSISFRRTLEKMAVPEHEQETVRQQLCAAFEANLLPYLSHSDFASGFACQTYRAKLNKSSACYRL